MFLFLTVLSGVSLLVFVTLVSLLFRAVEARLLCAQGVCILSSFERVLLSFPSLKSLTAAGCAAPLCLASVFLFIPMGSLPQFVSTAIDMFIMIFLIAVAQSLYIRGVRSFAAEEYRAFDEKLLYQLSKFIVAFVVFCGTLSWYILHKGVPGFIFSLNTYAAMPFCNVMNGWGKAGLFLFFILMALASPGRNFSLAPSDSCSPVSEVFDALRATLCPAVLTSIFFPSRLGLEFGLIGFPLYAVDCICFWFFVFVVQVFVIPAIQGAYIKIKSFIPERFELTPAVIIALLGVGLVMCNLYM